MKWFIKCLKQYADFSGRTRRKEFWRFTLFNVIIVFALMMIMTNFMASNSSVLSVIGVVLYCGYVWPIIVPSLAICVRRLHDIGISGWWFLIGLIPIVGTILLLVWFFTDSQAGENKWGAYPKK